MMTSSGRGPTAATHTRQLDGGVCRGQFSPRTDTDTNDDQHQNDESNEVEDGSR